MADRMQSATELRRWRVGRQIGRTIYAMAGPEASDDDELIGLMDTRELAADAVAAHNMACGHEEAQGAARCA